MIYTGIITNVITNPSPKKRIGSMKGLIFSISIIFKPAGVQKKCHEK
jgi:hypothetical protein